MTDSQTPANDGAPPKSLCRSCSQPMEVEAHVDKYPMGECLTCCAQNSILRANNNGFFQNQIHELTNQLQIEMANVITPYLTLDEDADDEERELFARRSASVYVAFLAVLANMADRYDGQVSYELLQQAKVGASDMLHRMRHNAAQQTHEAPPTTQ